MTNKQKNKIFDELISRTASDYLKRHAPKNKNEISSLIHKNIESMIYENKFNENDLYDFKELEDFRKLLINKVEQKIQINWLSPNKIWRIYFHQHFEKLVIENTSTGYIDFPTTYSTGNTAFDNPYEIPKYVKNKYIKLIN